MVDWSYIFWFLKVESASQHHEVLSAPYFFPYCSKDPCIFLHLLHANRAVTISDPLPPNNLIPKHENPRDTLLPFSSLLHTTFSRYFLDSLAQTSLVIDDTLIRAMLPERHTGGLNHILGQKSRKPCTPRALFGLRTVHNLCTSLWELCWYLFHFVFPFKFNNVVIIHIFITNFIVWWSSVNFFKWTRQESCRLY